MKTHPTCWNPTAAIRLKTYIAAAAAAAANAEALFRQPQQLTAVTGGPNDRGGPLLLLVSVVVEPAWPANELVDLVGDDPPLEGMMLSV